MHASAPHSLAKRARESGAVALGEGVADLGEELDLFGDLLGGRILGLLLALGQRVHRDDEEEVQGEGDEQEVNDGSQQDTELQRGAVEER